MYSNTKPFSTSGRLTRDPKRTGSMRESDNDFRGDSRASTSGPSGIVPAALSDRYGAKKRTGMPNADSDFASGYSFPADSVGKGPSVFGIKLAKSGGLNNISRG